MTRLHLLPATAMIALLAGACAGDPDRYPSLAIRDAERAQGSFTPVAPDPEPVRPVASTADIAALVDQAQSAHARFTASLPAAQRLVSAARGAGIESNTRQRALIALAELTSLRSDTALPMGDLDRLTSDAATTFAPTETIENARAEVQTILESQDAALDGLSGALSL